MFTIKSAGAIALAALALTGCATAGLEAAQSTAGLDAYKEFSRNCDRFYSWPFAVTVNCTKSRDADSSDRIKALEERLDKLITALGGK
jgi:hypothetical protein